MGSDDRKRHGPHGANGTKAAHFSSTGQGAGTGSGSNEVKVREGKHLSHKQRRDINLGPQPLSTSKQHPKQRPSSSNQGQPHVDLPVGKPKIRSRSAFEPTVRSDISRHDKGRPSSLTPTPAMSSNYERISCRGGTKGSGNAASSRSKSKKKTTGPVHNARYKAKLCKNWSKTGSCPYFEKCQFAHGSQELEKWANRRARIKAASEQNATTKSADEQVNDLSEEETKDGFVDQPETSPPVEKQVLVQSTHLLTLDEEGEDVEAHNQTLQGSHDERLELDQPSPVVQKHFEESYYAQPVDTTNQCIGQLFSMSTVFPSSILRN